MIRLPSSRFGFVRCALVAPVVGVLLLTPQHLGAQAERWTLVRDLRIGSEDRANYALSQVTDVAIGTAGDMYVAQPQEKLIRQYDARGTFRRSFGRAGSGPGEFQALERIGWKGDTLWVADQTHYRVSFFSSRGQVLGTAGKPGPVVPGSGYPAAPAALLNDGSVLGRSFPGSTFAGRTLPLLRMDRQGTVRGRYGSVEVLGQFASIRRARLALNMELPVPYNSLWDVAPDGSTITVVHRTPAASGDRSSFRVASYRASGEVVFDRAYRYSPRPISSASRDSIHEALAEFFVRTGFVQAAGQAQSFARDSVPLPRFQPPVTNLVIGRDGTIWLGRERLGVSTAEYLVLGRDGRILASVAVPPGVQIRQAQRNMVWGVETDDLDVPYLVRFRVTAAG